MCLQSEASAATNGGKGFVGLTVGKVAKDVQDMSSQLQSLSEFARGVTSKDFHNQKPFRFEIQLSRGFCFVLFSLVFGGLVVWEFNTSFQNLRVFSSKCEDSMNVLFTLKSSTGNNLFIIFQGNYFIRLPVSFLTKIRIPKTKIEQLINLIAFLMLHSRTNQHGPNHYWRKNQTFQTFPLETRAAGNFFNHFLFN